MEHTAAVREELAKPLRGAKVAGHPELSASARERCEDAVALLLQVEHVDRHRWCPVHERRRLQ